jgi:hypothetical protein
MSPMCGKCKKFISSNFQVYVPNAHTLFRLQLINQINMLSLKVKLYPKIGYIYIIILWVLANRRQPVIYFSFLSKSSEKFESFFLGLNSTNFPIFWKDSPNFQYHKTVKKKGEKNPGGNQTCWYSTYQGSSHYWSFSQPAGHQERAFLKKCVLMRHWNRRKHT